MPYTIHYWRLTYRVKGNREQAACPSTAHILYSQVDVVASQLELTLMNHKQGPNMPLLRVRVLDAYFGASEGGGPGSIQVDVQLPLEAFSYSAQLQEFECLLEPTFLGARLLICTADKVSIQCSPYDYHCYYFYYYCYCYCYCYYY